VTTFSSTCGGAECRVTREGGPSELAAGGAGLQRTPGKALADGFYPLENDSAETPMWQRRTPAIRGKIPALMTVNLVFRQTRTSDQPRSATVQIDYWAGGTAPTAARSGRPAPGERQG
jgi:hypothetical protein